ncbi:MAG: FAD:protein FMN transferase, partial [Limnochordia bacterium]|nr:FAD:protein FMN transferase [Limnochordia bacterium]
MSARGVNKGHSLVVFVVLLGLGIVTFLAYYLLYVPYLEAANASTQRTMMLMDTVVDVRVDGREPEELISQVFESMKDLEEMLSRFIPDSEIS